MVEEVKPLVDRVQQLESIAKTGKVKELRLPNKSKVRGSRAKKGWIGVLVVDENLNIHGEKVRLNGSAYRTKDGVFHATTGKETLNWNGRFPVVIQSSKRNNPVDFSQETNETYGQEYIVAKMLSGVITPKKKGAGGLVVLAVLAGIVFLLGKFVFKWF